MTTMRRLLLGLLAALLLMVAVLPRTTLAAPAAQSTACLFFTETGGGQGGFSVCDDGQAQFRAAFQQWGLQKVGYPVSRRYSRDGFVTQAFQKAIMQWRQDSNGVVLVNVFDDLHNAGYDQRLLETRQTPTQLPPGWDGAGLTFQQVVQKRQALLSARPALRTAYFASSDPLTFFGLPTSEVKDMGNHYAVRLQRAVLQEWKEDVPWARAGQVTIANGGDISKELGSLPVEALVAEAGPPAPVAGVPPAPAPPASPAPAPPAGPGASVGLPTRLRIPDLGVNAAVESVGQTSSGAMDVPQGVMNVGWYNLGARPGQVGNAVMSGHLDDYKGDAAVFWRLNELQVGDIVMVADANGREYRYEVIDKETYRFDDPVPLNRIFGYSVTSNLNLITCNGTWDRNARNYDKRLVVYTRLVR
ncbi:MAG TPA: class F sortase [Ardenticatenaceae bacterium]|jgi:sortase (surface protein transpeptidase)